MPILQVQQLSVCCGKKGNPVSILQDINFEVNAGECLGILGESGSGKSMTTKSIMGLLDRNFQVTGKALYQGVDLLQQNKEYLRRLRGKQVGMVLQNPMTCFDPLYTIGSQMAETFAAHGKWSKQQLKDKSIAVLERMQIHQTEEVLMQYPHQLSGGMLQRIMIGLAIAMEPQLLIADEPTTAIDAITQYTILEEFVKIKEQSHMAMIFISHDLGAISAVADRVLILNKGIVVDQGQFHEILTNAKDPYTQLLVEKREAVMKRYRRALSAEGRSL